MYVQTTKYTSLKEDLHALQHKVSDMEKREAEMKLKEDRKGLEEAVLRELREEEARIVVTGYAFCEADNNIVNKLVNDTLRKGVEPLEQLSGMEDGSLREQGECHHPGRWE